MVSLTGVKAAGEPGEAGVWRDASRGAPGRRCGVAAGAAGLPLEKLASPPPSIAASSASCDSAVTAALTSTLR